MQESTFLKPNIQFFAEGDPPADPPAAAPVEPVGDNGKTYSADYVSALRRESAGHRSRANTVEKAVRTAFALKDNEDVGDLSERLTAREAAILEKSNSRLIAAEMKGLEGYDIKLLDKLIDHSKITVDENGDVKGMKEAVEACAKEYPQVKVAPQKQPYAPQNPPPTDGGSSSNGTMNDLIRGRR